MPTPKASVTFTMNQGGFEPISPNNPFECSGAVMSLASGDHGVTLTGSGSNQQLNVSIVVDLEFTVVSQDSGVNYYPVGLAVTLVGSGDKTGRNTFPSGSFDTTGSGSSAVVSLTVKDLKPTASTFNFVVAVQRSTDGAFGAIDPKISNN